MSNPDPGVRVVRSIPACAGEPPPSTSGKVAPTVYPRVCGGTLQTFNEVVGADGLSPRVRGNRLWPLHQRRDRGSIPACAGEPWSAPRRRGWVAGLSPRVRGNRNGGSGRTAPPSVYPRVCGGTTFSTTFRASETGLSPRVRGNHLCSSQHSPSGWSIPACAGEPRTPHSRREQEWVYPRVCGGTPSTARTWSRTPALSPRVRGNPLPTTAECGSGGSIPACAGEPRRGPHQSGRPTGLSPRVRGNPTHTETRRKETRVYPRVCGGTSLG